MGISIILSLNILKKWYYLSFTPNNCTKSCKDALAANQIPIYPNRLVPIITPLELFMLSKHEASRQQFPNLKIAQPFGSSQKQKASKNQQLFSLLQQCQTLAKKKQNIHILPFPPTSDLHGGSDRGSRGSDDTIRRGLLLHFFAANRHVLLFREATFP